ncbi:MAG: DUF4230 domain-containing protein [Proteiniphilum sp.]|uniref:DUF4230 domain-containing protein n=1 Tax=Proteiniphilum sp. TaxID=1926877 RepID=UPI0009275BF0|nr:DUF4230 domain-containing protein [Proteiniphilum sp.]MEA5127566.1 DUF4230 domain-containing protein [Proteiniphilum sp.]OJV88012.1 MAG: hypothetical protein BGO34_13565 [Bacteroidia bacterium 44-10]
MVNTKIRINILTVFFFVLSVILAILLLAGNKKAEKERGYDSSSVMNRISYMQELALVRYNYTGVISYKDYRKFLNVNVPLTDKYFLLKYNGYIKAGVDFNRIKVNVNNDTTVHISIPKPKILDTVIDEKSIQVYNESENAFNPIKISDYNEAISQEKNVIIRDAIDQGIYRQATDEAKLAITSLLKEMGFTDIHITEELLMPPLH